MSDEHAFVEEIRRTPDDVTPRLIYADFLEDHGDPRGEFIRVQCELTEAAPGSAHRADLLNREGELLNLYGDEWLTPVRELGAIGVTIRSFERGLLERVRISAADFLESGTELCRIAPALSRLDLRRPEDVDTELATRGLPEQITELDFSANGLTEDWIRAVSSVSVRWLKQIQVLHLQTNRLGDGGAAALAGWTLPSLKSLSLGSNRISAAGLSVLLGQSWVRQLTELDLRMNPVTDVGLNQLVACHPNTWEVLNLSSCQLTELPAGQAPVNLRKLQTLILRHNRITPAKWAGLSGAVRFWLTSLRQLDLRNNAIHGRSAGPLPSHGID
ncbi:MAG: TIGR02996 domain-containing protein [Planctomycetaceae bacterium]